MRYYFALISLLLFGTLLAVSPPVARSQNEREGIEISAELFEDYLNVQGVYQPVELTPIGDPTRSINAASDECVDGASLPAFVSNSSVYLTSDISTVNGFASEATDPNLSACFTSDGGSPVGYRSAWYRFESPATGNLTVETVFSNTYSELYDTAVAIYAGDDCVNLVQLSCNDDHNGLLSRASAFVTEGASYYIEIVDRNQALNGTASANVLITIDSIDYWLTEGAWNTNAAFRSRHATAVVGDDIYVIGGQTVVNGISPQRTGRVDKFNTITGEWTALASFPSACAVDTNGYSNTSATYLEYQDNTTNETRRRIFLPSGYIGDDGNYAAAHCVYDVDSNSWLTAQTAPWTGGSAAAPAFASTAMRRNPTSYYVTGGLTGPWGQEGGETVNSTDVFLYLPQGDNWLNDPNLYLPDGRFAHTSAVISNRFLCVMGGLANPESSSNAAIILVTGGECIDLTSVTDGWSTLPATNISRFQASSAVGPDGRWYIWGGVTAVQQGNGAVLVPVAEIESYTPGDTEWEILDSRFNLDAPARSWARGGFVDNKLYVIGGESDFVLSASDPKYRAGVTGIVEELTFPGFAPIVASPQQYMPLFLNDFSSFVVGLRRQSQAVRIGGTYRNNFNDAADVFDVYALTLDSTKSVRFLLDEVPENDNYDLYLYNANKFLVAQSVGVGTLDERIDQTLAAGTYYLIVAAEDNDAITTGDYRLRLVNP